MRVTIVGCSDAFGSGGRFNTATLVEAAGHACLVDCGATTMTALNQRGIDPNLIDMIVLTHLHGDHFGGVPFLLLDAQWISGRTRPLTVAGPPGTRRRLHDAIEIFFAGSSARTAWTFPWRIEEITPGTEIVLAGFAIRTVEVSHPSGAPSTAVRLSAGGKVFVHSGDTEWVDALPQVSAGADLFFVECFAFDEPTPTHLDYGTLAREHPRFGAKRIVLTHMGPAMLAKRDAVDGRLFELAEDGLVFDL